MTTKIKLFTDSAADLPAQYKDKYGIEVVPLSVIFGTEEFKDQVTLSVDQFWDKLLTAQDLPSTNQVNPLCALHRKAPSSPPKKSVPQKKPCKQLLTRLRNARLIFLKSGLLLSTPIVPIR